jgi:uracil-DNA glycosylase family 4
MPAYDRSPFRKPSPFDNRPFRRVPPSGPENARVLLIGEKPGREEAQRGRPFIGISGRWMDVFLDAANVPRDTVRVTNLVWEFTEYTKPTAEEIARDHDDLVAEILSCNPEIIGLVGGWSVEHILMCDPEMEKCHGVPMRVPSLFGDELPREGGWVVIPILHPAGAVHSPESSPKILDDFLQLGRLLDGEIVVQEPDPYLGHEDYREFYGDEKTINDVAACDTEGSMRNPWCATISTQPGAGLLFKPGQSINFRNKVYLHNSLHDLGVLRSMGIELADDQFVDTMLLAYNLCIEPQGLKALAYRHCRAHQDDYADIIREASRDKAMEYLSSVLGYEWPDIEPFIVTVGGKPKIKKPWNITRRVTKIIIDVIDEKRDKDGNPTDPRKRWKEIDDYVRDPVEKLLGPMTEATLDDIGDPEKAKRYAIRDADITLRIAPILEQKICDMDLTKISAIDHAILPMLDRMQQVGIKLAPTEFWDGIERECEDQMNRAQWSIYQATGVELNPASGDQVADLLYNKLGITPPKLTDSGERGSVDGLALESLLSENPMVQHIMDYTEARKLVGTYVQPLRKLCTVGDGRVRSTIRSTRTTTGRLSMADPPLHQIPILSTIGKKLRGGFIVEEGNVFGDWDVDQLEMRLMAHDSRDEELCRLFMEGRDVHAETACKIFSVPMSQLSVNAETGKVNDYRRTVAKHAAFGIINGITEKGLVNYMILNRCRRPDGEPWTEDDCIQLLQEWFNYYRGVKRFHRDCMEETRETGLARESIGGRVIYLPQIWSPTKRVRETAERMSYVMHTQGGGQTVIKKAMKVVWKEVCKVAKFKAEPLLQMHDELLIEMPENKSVMAEVNDLMVKALTTTTILRVPMKASGGYGKNWLEAH